MSLAIGNFASSKSHLVLSSVVYVPRMGSKTHPTTPKLAVMTWAGMNVGAPWFRRCSNLWKSIRSGDPAERILLGGEHSYPDSGLAACVKSGRKRYSRGPT